MEKEHYGLRRKMFRLMGWVHVRDGSYPSLARAHMASAWDRLSSSPWVVVAAQPQLLKACSHSQFLL